MRQISGTTMRNVILALRDATGMQFDVLMREAKLERFVVEPPADSEAPAATDSELSALFGALYRTFGEAMTRRVLLVYGKPITPVLLAGPLGQQLAKEAGKLAPEAFVGWWAKAMARMMTAVWAPASVSEVAGAWQIILSPCPTCAEIRGARGPICSNTGAIYGEIATTLARRPITIVETECIAAGGERCVFEISKQQ